MFGVNKGVKDVTRGAKARKSAVNFMWRLKIFFLSKVNESQRQKADLSNFKRDEQRCG